jgi:HSP20 family protein
MPDKQTDVATKANQQLSRRESSAPSPFRMLERFADEVDRMFDEFGLGRGWGLGRNWGRSTPAAESAMWTPRIDVSQRNNELVIRADLPGMSKDDVKVDVTDDAIVIQGERRREHGEEKGGIYRSERSYGSFYRAIPLPEGAITDQAKASFKDGVLEITMPAPPEQVTRGRRIEIGEGGSKTK